MSIRVRVKDFGENKFGYYGDKRRKPGEEFFIEKEEHFSSKWMERVDGKPSPERKEKQITGDPKTRQPHQRKDTPKPDEAPADSGSGGEVI
jgi:hypothetical protein